MYQTYIELKDIFLELCKFFVIGCEERLLSVSKLYSLQADLSFVKLYLWIQYII